MPNVSVHVKVDHTAFILAAQNVHTDIVKCLIESNADVNMQFEDDRSAHILAAQNRHIDIVKNVIGENADINAG